MPDRQDTDVTALIERARELADAATPGPWESGVVGVYSEEHGYVAGHPDPSMSYEDRAFIAAARTLVPALAAALEAVTAQRDTAVAALENAPHASGCEYAMRGFNDPCKCWKSDAARALAALSSSTGGA